MALRFAFAFVCTCALELLSRGQALQEDTEARIPLEAWEAAACSAQGGAEGDCQLHLLQLRAQSLTAGVNSTDDVSTDGVSVQDQSDSLHATSSGSAAKNVSASSSAACTANDHARFVSMGAGHTPGSFPHRVASCADKALKWFVFHRDVMTRCISQSLGVSMSCASCYSYIGQYGYDHCKAQCVFSKWCGKGCLSCTKRSYPVVDACAGFQAPLPSMC